MRCFSSVFFGALYLVVTSGLPNNPQPFIDTLYRTRRALDLFLERCDAESVFQPGYNRSHKASP